MAELVSSPQQVVDNVVRYSEHPDRLSDFIAMTRAWYAVKHNDQWLFGPSKFVGYAEMTPERYLDAEYSRNDHGRVDAAGTVMDGRITEGIIRKWSQPIEPGHPLYAELSQALATFCARYKKKPNNRARLSVVVVDQPEMLPELEDDLVALMIAIFRRLTPAQRSAFRRAVD
jgi:hypothetical protein